MNLRKVYAEAIQGEYESLTLLIEFLILEKKVLTWESDYKELNLYFLPKHYARMTKLLKEYKEDIT